MKFEDIDGNVLWMGKETKKIFPWMTKGSVTILVRPYRD